MLSENLVKEFKQLTPSTKIIVSKAWPSFAPETKLQIIDSYRTVNLQTSEHKVSIPAWLHKLAINDEHEIVRIFATMNSTVGINWPNETGIFEFIKGDTEYETAKEIQNAIKKDKSNIVKNLLNSTNIFIDFASIPQDSRIISIRCIEYFELEIFIANLHRLTSELEKNDLIDCLDEIIGNMSNYYFTDASIENLNKAWSLLAGFDKDMAFRVARILPIKTLHNSLEVEVNNFLKLPPLALFWALKENLQQPTRELIKAAQTIIDDNQYDKNVRELAWKIAPEDLFDTPKDSTLKRTNFIKKIKDFLNP